MFGYLKLSECILCHNNFDDWIQFGVAYDGQWSNITNWQHISWYILAHGGKGRHQILRHMIQSFF